jgi:RNA polymerase sigma-70 factor, ECF subfamily
VGPDDAPDSTSDATEESAADRCRDLVRRIVDGDRDAERELVERYWRGIRIVLGRSSRDRAALDDLCQDTFRIALEKIRRGDIREPERLSGFMVMLARNLAIEHHRRVARQAERLQESAASDREPLGPADPLERLLQAENAQVVRQVLAELPSDRDREILFRYYLAEEDKDRICADLGLSSLHFNRVLFRARARYRELYTRLAQHTSSKPGGIGS